MFQQQQQQQMIPTKKYEPADPFAGLDNAPSTSSLPTSPANSTSGISGFGEAPPLPRPGVAISPSSAASVGSASSMPSATASVSNSAKAAPAAISPQLKPSEQPSAHVQALARLGVSPSPSQSNTASNTPVGSRATTPVPSRAATPVMNSRAPTPVMSRPTTPVKVQTPAEEEEARKQRERADLKTKAQMRAEKEDVIQEREVATVLGSSGVSIQGDDAVEVQLPVSSFNPHDYLAGSTGQYPNRTFSPIFRTPPFWALMNLNTYIHQQPVPPEKLKDRPSMYEQLSRALSFVSHVCLQTERNGDKSLKYLQSNHWACEACVKLISLLPHSAGASGEALDGLFMNFLNVFVGLIENVQDNQQLVLPGGWQQPEYTYLCLYIIRNCGNNKWSFTVVNTGKDGLQYHPASFDPETGKELKQLAMTVWDIPGYRVLDSTFWTLLFRMQVYPSRKNNAAFLYTKLMPALNSRPLLSNLDQGPVEYLEIPDEVVAQSYHPLARIALTSLPETGARLSKYSSLLLMNAAVELAYKEIANAPPSSMDPEDTRILKLSGRNLANFASTISPDTVGDGTLGVGLSQTWESLDKLLRKINYTASKPMDQYSHGLSAAALADDFAKGRLVSLKARPGSAAHPLFGRLRRDNYDEVVKNLMGDPRPDPILIPAVLTDEELPPVATDYMTASSYLQRLADACSLLLQQRHLIKNSPAFAASAAQHALTHVLPMPNSDPKFCFWRKGEMRRETQLNLLFLIRRICRIYSASTACVQKSRGLIAIRSTAFACAACIADAICRTVAVDDPSTFALHYSGLCEGPTEAFGIEAGSFDTLGCNLPIYDPAICSLRYQALDYLRALTFHSDGTPRPTIFNFDKSLSPMKGDVKLIDQLCIQLALQRPFPRTDQAMASLATNLITGRNGSVIEVLPEFEFFRDIIFHFKMAVSGKEETPEVPSNHTWLASESTLHWEVKRVDKEDPTLVYHVTAFKGHHQEFVERIAQQEESVKSKRSSFAGFLKLFKGKSNVARSRLSSADPTTVVNSCGDKFLSKK